MAWTVQLQQSRISLPYCDCKCNFEDMDNTRVKCHYIRLSGISDAEVEMDATQSKDVFRNMSKHPIKNALLRPDLPLSDLIHGPYRIMPPEMLHSSRSGLIMFIFESLRHLIPSKKI